jgi:20S proteasome alpha/beta subunit
VTVLVGISCSDGVVVGADSSATFGAHQNHKTIEQRVKKIFVVAEKIIIAGTGAVGACQRFTAAVDTAFNEKLFRDLDGVAFGKTLSRVGKGDFEQTGMANGVFAAMVAFPAKHDVHLCELSLDGFQPELKPVDSWFCSMGSGQSITDPFLGFLRRVFFPPTKGEQGGQPSLKEGLFLATWALMHTIELNPGGINGPPQIAILEKESATARLLEDDELEEHKNSYEAAELHLSSFRDILMGETGAGPDAPTRD